MSLYHSYHQVIKYEFKFWRHFWSRTEEKPQEESDLEDEVFFKNGEEDLDKTNDNILLHAVIWRGLPGYFYFDVIRRGLPGFGSNCFFW